MLDNMSEITIEKLEIEKFNPTVMEIQKVVDDGRSITISDFSNKLQVKAVRDQRIKLKEIRVAITKQGKMFRQKALDFQKAVIGKEKELVALVEPEEVRLEDLENQASAFEEREKRRELLPKRKERLATIKDDIDNLSDDDLLDMDSTAFEGYCNKRFADKNEKDRVELEAKGRAIKEAEVKAAREKEIKDAEDRARADERKRAEEAEVKLKEERERAEKESKERIVREEREAKERSEKVEREAKERAERLERETERLQIEAKEKLEREERERKEKVEAEARAEAEQKEKLAKDKKYQEFLSTHGWSKRKEADFHIEVKGNTHTLYKKVGEITL